MDRDVAAGAVADVCKDEALHADACNASYCLMPNRAITDVIALFWCSIMFIVLHCIYGNKIGNTFGSSDVCLL